MPSPTYSRTAARLAALALLLLLPLPLTAQGGAPTPAGEIRGMVMGDDGRALAGASVEIRAGQALVTGAITDGAGRFRVQGLRPGQYQVRVTFLGYETQTTDVAVTPSSPADIGQIRLAAQTLELDGIDVTAERNVVSLQVDRTVYDARQSASTGGTATDVLREVPGVDVDIDGKVSLRGNQNVAIQINGRPAPLRGDALANFLKQMPANVLDRVEVIPNPSARHDPEGMGGIINLVMRQNVDLGLSGGMNSAVGTGGQYNLGGNLGYQGGPWTLFGTVGANGSSRGNDSYMFRRNLFGGTPSYLEQTGHGDAGFGGQLVNLNAEYRFTPKTSASSSFMANRSGGEMNTFNTYRRLDADSVFLDETGRTSLLEQSFLTTDASLGLRRVVEQSKHELSGELRFNRGANDGAGRYFRTIDGAREALPFETNRMDAVRREASAQIDYTRPLGADFKLEIGEKSTLRSIDNDFEVETRVGDPAEVTLRANQFTYQQWIHAGYATLGRQFGDVGLQAGLRAERTDTRFDVTGTNEHYEDGYTSLFPSASALWSLSDASKLRFSYSRRIQRPHVNTLNPFPMSDEPLNRFVGNPALRPEYTDAYEVSLQRQLSALGSLQLTPYFRRTTDAIRIVKSVSEEGVSTTTFQNLATAQSYGADVTLAGGVPRLRGMISMSAFRMTTDGSNIESGMASDALTWNARANLTWRVTPKLNAQWFVFHRAPLNLEQGRMSSFTMSNFALQHRVLADKGTITLRVADPFDMMRMSFQTEDANHWQDSWRKPKSRIVFLGFGYSFGRPPRLQRPQAQQQGEDVPDVRIQ